MCSITSPYFRSCSTMRGPLGLGARRSPQSGTRGGCANPQACSSDPLARDARARQLNSPVCRVQWAAVLAGIRCEFLRVRDLQHSLQPRIELGYASSLNLGSVANDGSSICSEGADAGQVGRKTPRADRRIGSTNVKWHTSGAVKFCIMLSGLRLAGRHNGGLEKAVRVMNLNCESTPVLLRHGPIRSVAGIAKACDIQEDRHERIQRRGTSLDFHGH